MPSGIYLKTKEHRKKISEGMKGNQNSKGKKRSEESKRKISIATEKAWQNTKYEMGMKNKKHTEESKKKISIICKGKKLSEETKRKISKNNARYWKGKKLSEEIKRKIGLANSMSLIGNQNTLGHKHNKEWKREQSERMKGEKHPNWQGGKSFEPYSPEFNYNLKELIRNRDNRVCQFCNKTKEENGNKLTVHHIDYNKKNNKPENLITLCNSCNAEANGNRNYWTEYFQGVINAYN